MANHIQSRSIILQGRSIDYLLERKPVKNINLRVRKDGSVYVSAHRRVPLAYIEAFLLQKSDFILQAIQRFAQAPTQPDPAPRECITGEIFYLLGQALTLQVSKGEKNAVWVEDACLHLQLKDPDDRAKRRRLLESYFNQQCRTVFEEILTALHPLLQPYGVAMPQLRLRSMTSRWGSCATKKGSITLNKKLLCTPRSCIEYVVLHELCHFVHPNHSRQFYELLSTLLPDWKERRDRLNRSPVPWL